MEASRVEACYSGEEEEGINTDHEDCYSYDYDSDEEHEDDDYDEATDHKPIYGDVTILKAEDIRQRQEKDIIEVSSVLQVSKEAACLLLRAYDWSVSKVHEEWFADEEKVRSNVGIIVVVTPKVRFPDGEEYNCGICFEEYTCKDLYCAGCGHLYCDSCWECYISTSINDGPGCLRLRCPEPSCAASVGRDMIGKFASDDDKEKYYNFLCRSYVENSRMIKWCPAPGCDLAVEVVAGSEIYDVICGCSYGFCWNCKEEAHRPVDCETVKKWNSKRGTDRENKNWIIVNCKPCPKCSSPIAKNQGCMHMTCRPPCGFQFCWLCLGSWSNHGAGTGGYYACNRYEGARRAGDYVEVEKNRERAKKALERYTHYFEREAANSSSRLKALEDLNEMKKVHLEKLKVHGQTEVGLKFILEAWQQIVECRRVLKWTYVYGYYIYENKTTRRNEVARKKELFEHLQGEAESSLERFHGYAERELMKRVMSGKVSDHYNDKEHEDFNEFRKILTGLTNMTRNYFENLVTALENDLSD